LKVPGDRPFGPGDIAILIPPLVPAKTTDHQFTALNEADARAGIKNHARFRNAADLGRDRARFPRGAEPSRGLSAMKEREDFSAVSPAKLSVIWQAAEMDDRIPPQDIWNKSLK